MKKIATKKNAAKKTSVKKSPPSPSPQKITQRISSLKKIVSLNNNLPGLHAQARADWAYCVLSGMEWAIGRRPLEDLDMKIRSTLAATTKGLEAEAARRANQDRADGFNPSEKEQKEQED